MATPYLFLTQTVYHEQSVSVCVFVCVIVCVRLRARGACVCVCACTRVRMCAWCARLFESITAAKCWLQHTAPQRNALQHQYREKKSVARSESTSRSRKRRRRETELHGRSWAILQHIATHCNILQHTATHCNTLLDQKSTFHQTYRVGEFQLSSKFAM